MSLQGYATVAVVATIGLTLHAMGLMPLPVWKDGRIRQLWWCQTGQHYHVVPHPESSQEDE